MTALAKNNFCRSNCLHLHPPAHSLHSLFILLNCISSFIAFLLALFIALYIQHHEILLFPAGFARIPDNQDTSPANSPIPPNQTSSIRQWSVGSILELYPRCPCSLRPSMGRIHPIDSLNCPDDSCNAIADVHQDPSAQRTRSDTASELLERALQERDQGRAR